MRSASLACAGIPRAKRKKTARRSFAEQPQPPTGMGRREPRGFRGRRRRRGRRGERERGERGPERAHQNVARSAGNAIAVRSEPRVSACLAVAPEARTGRDYDYGPPAGYQPILLPGESISKYQPAGAELRGSRRDARCRNGQCRLRSRDLSRRTSPSLRRKQSNPCTRSMSM